jgi:hypothetical protein
MHYPLMPFLHYIIRSKLNNIFHVMEKTKTDLHLDLVNPVYDQIEYVRNVMQFKHNYYKDN